MTEIPEHLLKRSQARKAGGDAAAAANTPAVVASAAPAVAAAPKADVVPAGPPPPKPDIPVVAAYKERKKIPVWAMVTLSILPLWLFMYMIALRPVAAKASGPIAVGAAVYGKNCSGCHMPGGVGVEGGAYAFTEGSAMLTFPHIEDQLRWVYLGTSAYQEAGITIPGDPLREGGPHITGSNGAMPGQKGLQTDAEILGSVCEERYVLGDVAEEGEEWELWCAEEAPVWIALETNAATLENIHEVLADKGIMEIGGVPVAGTTAD